MSDVQCMDLQGDRAMGAYWERVFCEMMKEKGKTFTPLQIGRKFSAVAEYLDGDEWKTLTLPDITVWTFPGEHHEIKHKTATRGGYYGLEEYRFEALLRFAEETQQRVMYTIHDHGGNRHSKENNYADWVTADVRELKGKHKHRDPNGTSYYGGKKRTGIPILYWHKDLFLPLPLMRVMEGAA